MNATRIAIINQKGGVGKTTVAVNCSAIMAEDFGKRVLLVDADPQGNASQALGFDAIRVGEHHFGQLLVKPNNWNPDEVIRPTDVPNLDIVPNQVDVAEIEAIATTWMAAEFKLNKALKLVDDKYDFIFIDCPPSLNKIVQNALTAGDYYLVTIKLEPLGMTGASSLQRTIRQVRENLNSELKMLGAVATFYDARTRLSKEMLQEAQDWFDVFQAVINTNVRLAEAPRSKGPISRYAKRSRGYADHYAVTKEILERIERLKKEETTGQ